MGCFFGMGDCGAESTSTVSLKNSTLNQNITNILQRSSSSVQTSSLMTQVINITPCPVNPDKVVWNCGPNPLQLSQMMSGTIKTITTLSDTDRIDIIRTIQNHVNQNAQSAADASTMFLSLTKAESHSAVDVSNYISNLVNTTLTSEKVQSIISIYNLSQTMNFPACGTINASSCIFGQNMILSLIADNMINAVSEVVSNDSFLNDLTQKGGSTATADVSLLNMNFGGLMKGITQLIILVIIVIVLAMAAKLVFRRGKGKDPDRQQKAREESRDLRKMQELV
jgi:hypothetical protein